jgi:Bifunctional DNA primase/polymerase, N-terminal
MQNHDERPRSSSKRRVSGHFNSHALPVVKNGFTVIPTKGKQPVTRKWQNPKPTDRSWLAKMVRLNRYGNCNVGIVCGRVVAIDIDAEEQGEADRLKSLAFKHLGPTGFIRLGRKPRLLLLYRPGDSIDSVKSGCVEILSFGRQFVAYGIHPDTGQNYQWADAQHNPANAPIDALPMVMDAAVRAFMETCAGPTRASRIDQRVPSSSSEPTEKSHQRLRRRAVGAIQSQLADRVQQDGRGLVVDGREAYLTMLIATAYATSPRSSPEEIARTVWAKFMAEADLNRPKGRDSRKRWEYSDALAKARFICRRKPNLKTRRRLAGRHPVAELHSWRRPGFWTAEKRQQHVAEAGQRVSTPSVMTVLRAMIEAVEIETGFCRLPIAETAALAKCSETAVKNARAKLIEAGLWLRGRGLYVPMPCTVERTDNEVVQIARKTSLPGQPENRCSRGAGHRSKQAQAVPTKRKTPVAGHPEMSPLYRLVSGGAVDAASSPTGEPVRSPAPPVSPLPSASPWAATPEPSSAPRRWYQPDLFGGEVVDLETYRHGRLPSDVAQAIRQEARAFGVSQHELARFIGLSRPHFANALAGRDGLSSEPAARLIEWLRSILNCRSSGK